ncbi:hypothetical protein LTR84_006397 [Exophiala bonariae]|uniref:Amidohydrolase-related domain-containing protein n=1 Tax=Exophiala bonariae TaxID=1690606 RepID=A0AAV9N4Z2_9EURO|nr:hypothetical protein LTR84_006397 [Exophiala bonariae]
MKAAQDSRSFNINNVRVFDGHDLSALKAISVSGGVIVASPVLGAKEINGHGGVLIPGLIDAHIHLNTAQELKAMARYGVTTGLDMGTWPASKISAQRGHKHASDFRTSGAPATSPGSVHATILPMMKSSLISSPDEAVRFVQERLAENVDYIKMIAEDPGPDQATLDAVVVEAHRHGKLVVAHASELHAFHMAQDAHTDVITHVPCDAALDDTASARMAADNQVSVPTLTMMKAIAAPFSARVLKSLLSHPNTVLSIISATRRRQHPSPGKPVYTNARASVTALHRAGVPILAGSDAHIDPASPVSVVHGEALHQELELLVEAGLSCLEALRAATVLPARYFGLQDRGAVEGGRRADLVLLRENPLVDIRNTRSISAVWCAGVLVPLA